jgi:hypothetical protein
MTTKEERITPNPEPTSAPEPPRAENPPLEDKQLEDVAGGYIPQSLLEIINKWN